MTTLAQKLQGNPGCFLDFCCTLMTRIATTTAATTATHAAAAAQHAETASPPSLPHADVDPLPAGSFADAATVHYHSSARSFHNGQPGQLLPNFAETSGTIPARPSSHKTQHHHRQQQQDRDGIIDIKQCLDTEAQPEELSHSDAGSMTQLSSSSATLKGYGAYPDGSNMDLSA